jgi:PAS domain S-box-containing protein
MGYSRKELEGMKKSRQDPDFKPEVWSQSVADLKKRKTQFITTRHRCNDGIIIDVEIRASYVHGGDIEYSFLFVRDITDRKKAEKSYGKVKRSTAILPNSSL